MARATPITRKELQRLALQTVVVDPFFTRVAEFVRKFAAEKGEFALAMLLPSEGGLPDKWNLVMSARRIDAGGRIALVPTITAALKRQLPKTDVSKFARVSILPTSSALVADLSRLDILPGTPYRVQTFELTARGLEDAVVLAAKRPRRSTSSAKQSVRTRA